MCTFFKKDLAISYVWKLFNQRILTDYPTVTEGGRIQQVQIFKKMLLTYLFIREFPGLL